MLCEGLGDEHHLTAVSLHGPAALLGVELIVHQHHCCQVVRSWRRASFKKGFNCVSCGTHRGGRASRASFPQNENPARVRRVGGAGSREPSFGGVRRDRQWWRCGSAGRKSWRLRPNRGGKKKVAGGASFWIWLLICTSC